MNSTNLITAIDDPRLYGNCLMVPLRASIQAFQNTFSAWPANLPLSQNLSEIFKRTLLFMGASLGSAIASPFALTGIAVKWFDLGLRIDQLVHKGSAMGYHLPLLLKIYSRLGDCVVAYLNAKYVAEKHHLPLCFVPFKGCDIFQFSEEESLRAPQYFKKVVYLKRPEEIEALAHIGQNESTLYLLSFSPHRRDLEKESATCSYIKYTVDWASFRGRVRHLLQVIKPYTPVAIPANAYSIALHIREGGRYDDERTKTLQPLKLPPMSFYLGELRRVLTSDLKSKNIFIHIFTDAVNPTKVRDEVQRTLASLDLSGREVTLSYNQQANLTDDIANMSRFQCMIRPDSSLSGPIAEGSDALELEIFPTHFAVDPAWKTISISRVRIVRHRNETTNAETDYSKPVVTGGLPRWFFQKFYDYYGIMQS